MLHHFLSGGFAVHDVTSDEAVEGVLSGASDEEQDEGDEVDEGQLLDGEGIGAMYHEEGYAHGDDHRDEHEAMEDAEDEGKGAYQFGKDGEHERVAAAYAERVVEEGVDAVVGHQLIVTMDEEQDAEEDAYHQQEGGVGAALVVVGGKEEMFQCHGFMFG